MIQACTKGAHIVLVTSRNRSLSFIVILWTICLVLRSAQGQETLGGPQTEETFLTADRIIYHQSLFTATGQVEIRQGGATVTADTVIYNEETGVVSAIGDVMMMDLSGYVTFADQASLSDRLSTGFIDGLYLVMANDARLAARHGQKDGDRIVMDYAVYSPCKICSETQSVLWQIKAVKVERDKERQHITYQDASLEFFGIPVLYSPWFRHPDPEVTRQTGLLSPVYGRSRQLGTWIKPRYFWAIAEDRDLTVTPFLTQKYDPVLLLEYRQAFRDGEMTLNGSAAYQRKVDHVAQGKDRVSFRGHLEVDAHFTPTPVWSYGVTGAHTTDDTFLRLFDIMQDTQLESRVFLEGRKDRDSATIEAYYWQGLLETDDPGDIPFVFPLLDTQFYTPMTPYGSRWHLTANAASVKSDNRAHSHRITGRLQWRLPYTAPMGDIYTLETSLRGDLYHIDHHLLSPANRRTDGWVARMRPSVRFEWRYPLQAHLGSVRHMIEPFFDLRASPRGGNKDSIPNLDSTTFEFDDTNLTTENRYPGFDRVDGGSRVAVGLKTGLYGETGGYSELVFGQSLRLDGGLDDPIESGAEEKTSDYVGHMTMQPNSFWTLEDRIRLDGESLKIKRHETSLNLGPDWLRLGLNYASLAAPDTLPDDEDREQLNSNFYMMPHPDWTVSFSHVRDLTKGGGNLSWTSGIKYLDECFEIGIQTIKNYHSDREIRSSTNTTFYFKLITLG